MKKLLSLFIMLLVFASCKNESENYVDIRGEEFSGSESCIQCHQNISEISMQNSHFKASMPGIKENLLGDFDKDKDAFVYNPNLKLKMHEQNDSLYQVVYYNDKIVEFHPFDIVFGTKHAQTSMFWKDEKAFELPISYYKSTNGWATSPGFDSKNPFFGRQVLKDCFSCHSSNIKSPQPKGASVGQEYGSSEISGKLDRNSIVYGIDCERCHGPAKKHVQYHLKFPKATTSKFIVTHFSLNNQQKLDRCAVCHSGNQDIKLKSRFDFRPGDSLSNFYLNKNKTLKDASFDVHGNQAELLKQSMCFKKNNALNCVTCHNPHTNAEKSTEYYSNICINCHQESSKVFCKSKSVNKKNCIDCHMPKQNSKAIRFTVSGNDKTQFYSLKTHKIGIYKTKNSINTMKN